MILTKFVEYQSDSFCSSKSIHDAKTILERLKPSSFAEHTFPDSLLIEASILKKHGIPTFDIRKMKKVIENRFLGLSGMINFVKWDHYSPSIIYHRR